MGSSVYGLSPALSVALSPGRLYGIEQALRRALGCCCHRLEFQFKIHPSGPFPNPLKMSERVAGRAGSGAGGRRARGGGGGRPWGSGVVGQQRTITT